MDQIVGALELFHHDTGRYPTTEEGLQALLDGKGIDQWFGPYMEEFEEIPSDQWGRPFQFTSDGNEYLLLSLGADGLPGGEEANADLRRISQRPSG